MRGNLRRMGRTADQGTVLTRRPARRGIKSVRVSPPEDGGDVEEREPGALRAHDPARLELEAREELSAPKTKP